MTTLTWYAVKWMGIELETDHINYNQTMTMMTMMRRKKTILKLNRLMMNCSKLQINLEIRKLVVTVSSSKKKMVKRMNSRDWYTETMTITMKILNRRIFNIISAMVRNNNAKHIGKMSLTRMKRIKIKLMGYHWMILKMKPKARRHLILITKVQIKHTILKKKPKRRSFMVITIGKLIQLELNQSMISFRTTNEIKPRRRIISMVIFIINDEVRGIL